MTFRKFAAVSVQTVRYGAIVLAVLLALYVAAGRQFFPWVNDFRSDIESALTSALGAEVRIHHLSGRWNQFNPVLVMNEVRVPQWHLDANELSFELSFWESLTSWRWKLATIRLDGISLSLKQAEDGTWNFAFASTRQDDQAQQPPARFDPVAFSSQLRAYLVYPSVVLTHSQIIFDGKAGASYTWRIPQAQMVVEDELFRVNGKLYSSGQDDSFTRFTVRGQLPEQGGVRGSMYFSWDSGAFFNDILTAYKWRGTSIHSLKTHGQLWLTVEDMTITEARAQVWAPELVLSVQGIDQPARELPAISQLYFDLLWQQGDETTAIDVSDFSFRWKDAVWPGTQLVYRSGGANRTVAMDYLDVGMLAGLVEQTTVAGESVAGLLSSLAPRGRLRNVHLDLPVSADDGAFRLEANLDRVSVEAYDGKPSARNVSGYLYASQDEGQVLLDAEDFELGFPDLFLQPWQLARAQADLGWTMDPSDRLRLFSKGIRLIFPENDRGIAPWLEGDFYSLLPVEDSNNWLSLSIAMHHIDAADTTRFVPFYRVPPRLYDWLKGIHAGEVSDGRYIGHGLVGDEDPDSAFASALWLNFEGVQLTYAPRWPDVSDARGSLVLSPSQLQVELPGAAMGGVNYQAISVGQRYAQEGMSPLDIRFATRLDKTNYQRVMTTYPFRDKTRPIAEAIQPADPIPVTARVTVPLDDPDQTRVQLAARFAGQALHITDGDLQLERLYGTMRYDTVDGLSADTMTLTLFDDPLTLAAHTDVTEEARRTSVRLKGELSVEPALAWAGLNVPGVSGQTLVRGELTVTEPRDTGEEPVTVELSVSSALVGVEIGLPPPFFKISPSELPFSYHAPLRGKVLPDQFRLGDWVSGTIDRGSGREKPAVVLRLFESGDAEAVSLPDATGLVLRGKLPAVNLDQWAAYLDPLTVPDDRPSGESMTIGSLDAQLQIESLRVASQSFPETMVTVHGKMPELAVDFRGEAVSGRVAIPDVWALSDKSTQLPVTIHIDHVYLQSEDAPLSEASGATEPLDFEQLPLSRVTIESLYLNGALWGSWYFEIEPSANAVRIDPLRWRLADSLLEGRARWLKEPSSGHQSTVLTGQMKIRHFADMLRSIGVADPLVDADKGVADVSLVWPGSPFGFSTDKLSGQMAFHLDNGKINTSADSSNALKLFSLFNLDTLSRRLRLDFTDLVNQGVAFDVMEAECHLELGALTLRKPLVMTGPSVGVKLAGKTSLVDESLAMTMDVVFPLAGNLPWAAVVVGGPAVGGAFWAIDKLLEQVGDPISQLTSARYEISGSWQKPVVKMKGILGVGNDAGNTP